MMWGVPQELSVAASTNGSIPLSYHSDRSPSAVNDGGLNEIVGTPLAVLVIEPSDKPGSPTFKEASLQTTA